MSDIDYKRLAQEIVAEQSKEFLSFDEVCVMLGYKPRSSAVKKITEQDDFPLSTQLTETGYRRWFKKDVLNWIEKQRQVRSKCALSACYANRVA